MPFCQQFIPTPANRTDLVNVIASKAVLDIITSSRVETAVVNAGGTGYAVGDVVRISGGTAIFPARVEVTAVAAGVVSAVRLISDGAYTTLPGVTGAATAAVDADQGERTCGTGLTVNLTTASADWLASGASGRDDYVDDATDFEWIATGTNASGTNPVVGLNTVSNTNGSVHAEGLAATGFDDLQTFANQPGANPMDTVDAGPKIRSDWEGHLVRVTHSPRRIIIQYDFGGGISQHCYLGDVVPFADDPNTDWPAPLLASGSGGDGVRFDSNLFDDARNGTSFIVHPSNGSATAAASGHQVRDDSATWQGIDNAAPADSVWFVWPYNGINGVRMEDAPTGLIGGSSGSTTPSGSDTGVLGEKAVQNDLGGTITGAASWVGAAVVDASDQIPGFSPIGTEGRNHMPVEVLLFREGTAGSPNIDLMAIVDGVFDVSGMLLRPGDRIFDANGAPYYVYCNGANVAPRRFAIAAF